MKNFVILLVAFVFVFCSCSKDNSGVQKITSANDCEYCINCGWENGEIRFYNEDAEFCIKPKMSGELTFKCCYGSAHLIVHEKNGMTLFDAYFGNPDIASCVVHKDKEIVFKITDTDNFYFTLSDIKIVGNGSSGVEQDDSDNENYNDF
ncbi:MAG: hypothetical protein IKP45_06955 [Bacteroidales bacterium]|nr:hypothetical protein [Bacteroidales bacterium]